MNERADSIHNRVDITTAQGGVHFHGATTPPEHSSPGHAGAMLKYNGLPAPTPLADRFPERAQLAGLADAHVDRTLVVMISGPSGWGKSALANWWLHDIQARFAALIRFDFNRHNHVASTGEVAAWCLRALHVRVPDDEDERLHVLRSVTHVQPIALLIDNVPLGHDLLTNPLALNSPGSVVVMTSQQSGRGVSGVAPVELRTLPADAALEVLSANCPQDFAAEAEAAANIVELCGCTPLALRLVNCQLQRRTTWTLAKMADRLRDERQRLGRLSTREPDSITGALDLAYDQLLAAQQTLYQHLGLIPGPSFAVAAVAALVGEDEADVEEQLWELHEVNLVHCDDQDLFRFHDLVRLHAREKGEQRRAAERPAALARLADWYRTQGAFIDRAVMGVSRMRISADAELGAGQENPYTKRQALEWLEREHDNLVALVLALGEEPDEHGDQSIIALCDGPLWALHNQHKHYTDMFAALKLAIAAAQRTTDVLAETRMRTLHVRLLMECRRFDEAHAEAHRARALGERSGNRAVLASAIEFHGRVYLEEQRWAETIETCEQAREHFAELGNQRGIALQEHFLGQAHAGLGEHERAEQVLTSALDRIAAFPDDHRTPARIHVSLGRLHQQCGRHAAAVDVLRNALAELTAAQMSFDQAKPCELLGESFAVLGEDALAREYWERARRYLAEAHSPEADRLTTRLTG